MATSERKKAANRENGKKGGRRPIDALGRKKVDQAAREGRSLLLTAVRKLKAILESSDSTNMDRISAAREICDRFGLPKRTDVVQQTQFTQVLVKVDGDDGWPDPITPAGSEPDASR